MKPYTAIWEKRWTSESHSHCLTKFTRFFKKDEETVFDAMKREGIGDEVVYIFEGHPKLIGESHLPPNKFGGL